MGGCKVLLWTWLHGKMGWCSAPIFNMTNPFPFQDALATCWERGRTCPAMMRRGGASACPTWWATTATSVRLSTGTWGAAGAAGPAAATLKAPAAPTATRYRPARPQHPQGRFSVFQQYFVFISLPSFMHAPASLLALFPFPALQTLL